MPIGRDRPRFSRDFLVDETSIVLSKRVSLQHPKGAINFWGSLKVHHDIWKLGGKGAHHGPAPC